MVFYTWRQYIYYRRTERAYVAMAHTPEGIHEDGHHQWRVRVEIRNCGNTPAAVEYGVIRLQRELGDVEQWPERADVDHAIPGGFLVRNKHYNATLSFDVNTLDRTIIRAGKMWLLGWMVYRDTFGRRHRAGYARHVTPGLGNNLHWDDTSSQYNHDTEIAKNGRPKKKAWL